MRVEEEHPWGRGSLSPSTRRETARRVLGEVAKTPSGFGGDDRIDALAIAVDRVLTDSRLL